MLPLIPEMHTAARAGGHQKEVGVSKCMSELTDECILQTATCEVWQPGRQPPDRSDRGIDKTRKIPLSGSQQCSADLCCRGRLTRQLPGRWARQRGVADDTGNRTSEGTTHGQLHRGLSTQLCPPSPAGRCSRLAGDAAAVVAAAAGAASAALPQRERHARYLAGADRHWLLPLGEESKARWPMSDRQRFPLRTQGAGSPF